MDAFKYYIIYKPYGMLCQFTREGGKPVLGDLFKFPKDVYPVGRLDTDSEGLLILTNDKKLNHRLLDPKYKHKRTYLAQVEGEITKEAIDTMEKGILINIDGIHYKTQPAKAEIVPPPENIPERNPPVRFRKTVPTSWITLNLHEGKNRQVRKMTAAVGFPTLRLIRIAIATRKLDGMLPGDVREIDKIDF